MQTTSDNDYDHENNNELKRSVLTEDHKDYNFNFAKTTTNKFKRILGYKNIFQKTKQSKKETLENDNNMKSFLSSKCSLTDFHNDCGRHNHTETDQKHYKYFNNTNTSVYLLSLIYLILQYLHYLNYLQN